METEDLTPHSQAAEFREPSTLLPRKEASSVL